jgi:UDP-N-acetylglucosamine:LPS N-acetylglucosamine transferase
VDFVPWRLGELLRRMYFLQLRSVPGTWESLLHRLEPGQTLHGAVVRALAMTADPLLSIATRSEVIISTHPFASQALGHLRESGRLDVPVVTYLTDMSVHPLWVHQAVDLHLALHEIPAAQARLRQVTTRVIEPLVPIDFARRPADVSAQRELRARLGLPPDKPLALVTGGSLGVGEMSRSARDIARTGLATPVVLCGENRSLYHRLGADQLDVVRLGWRDDVPDLLRSVNCVVQNAGGFTSLEAIAAGTPALSYRCIPGHGRTNAQALHDAGLIPWAKDERELHRELQSALTRVVPAHHSGPGPMADIVDAVFPERIDVPA